MRLLLDTHALIWAHGPVEKLSPAARNALLSDDNEVLVSPVCAFEITTKYRIGKLPESEVLAKDFFRYVARAGFLEAPLTIRHAELAGRFAHDHKDPFDRLLIAQALVDDLVIVSNEKLFDDFGVNRLW
ncbi:MAG: type II toxin-antitoxin system VapC family toxin [Rhizobiales bacterium]|nr:type II toxin-antitoxin system VapC family toxin [Hyphomicrobiales bacterium]